ncbi:GGDEF domain-containing protein [Oceanicoccus sp. KOV_DT_Chl]|uniref:GGDEF domain-containing protein n=1 Tax=Oceanicoccus sp. KOV_DT_Chl TaxID=1904639 RepID=UPI00135A2490|nr:GGDEF domain-containing protein [Oceanicoccus sp. KOV_DT_Chl]
MYKEAVLSALRDPLTGSGNRLALENTLEREIALATRHKLPLSLLVVDIDKFKLINDDYGHAAGDYVLKDVASNLAQCSRETDSAYRAYRFGGEEFVLVLNNTSNQGAAIVAERIRQSIEKMTTTFEDNSIAVTVSVGLATLMDGDNMSSLFSRADKALYRAKGKGRNQVMNAQECIEQDAC